MSGQPAAIAGSVAGLAVRLAPDDRLGLFMGGVEHRLTKPYHPWTNGQAERMVRTIKDATVRSFHYATLDDLRRHVRDWLLAYNYAKQLKALRFKTPMEALQRINAEKPELFVRLPRHDMPGLNT